MVLTTAVFTGTFYVPWKQIFVDQATLRIFGNYKAGIKFFYKFEACVKQMLVNIKSICRSILGDFQY